MIATALQQSIREKVEQAYPFTVRKVQLFNPDMKPTPHFGLERSDNGESVGNTCRAGYEPHTRDDVLALAEASAAAFDTERAAVQCGWKEGHYLILGPTHEQRRNIFGSDDSIFPRLMIRAGYNGRAFRATLGFYLDACRNLAMLSTIGEVGNVSLRHTAQLRDRMPELVSQFRSAADGWEECIETAQRLEAQRHDVSQFVAKLYPLPSEPGKATVTNYRNRAEAIVTRILRERDQLGRTGMPADKATGWELFNAVQGYVQHDQRRRGDVTPVDRAIMAWNEPIVRRAEELALAM